MAKTTGDFVALTRCFLCGEGDQILIHKNLRDISHLHNRVVTREPCPKCAELMRQGIILISVRDGEPESNNPYRTGNFVCVKEDFMRRVVQPADHPIFSQRFAFIEDSVWQKLGIPFTEPPCPNAPS